MPLTLVQLELALDEELKRKVLAVHSYLSGHPNLAFTGDEVAAALDLSGDEVSAILEKFDDLDLVDRGRVNGELYYLYLKDLPELR